MILLFDFSLPFKDPVLVFSVVLFIIFFAPIILKKFRIPGIIGMILAGVAVGPNGFNLLLRNSSIILFGTVGLLYLMFLAGLEIDMNDFKRNRNKSFVFGAFTFFIPLTLGTIVCLFILNMQLQSAILLASMFATHTLVSYPIASRLGITKNEAVTISIGGTIITDTAVLLILAVITGSSQGNITFDFWVKLFISLIIFSFVVLWGFAKLTKWFFRNIPQDGGSQYIYVLSIVFASAFLAELAGVEPIIGAFLAGISLNRLIPHTSPLMNRIEFIGNNLFIPFFLISVGMVVDLKVLFNGYVALLIAAILIVIALFSKWLAAYLTQKTFGYSSIERNLIFGLTSSHAAATLAIILVGFDIGLFDENILNGTILLILATCLVSSFVTENSGRKFAIQEASKKPEISDVVERILLPISNPLNIEQKIDLAVMLKEPNSAQPIFALSVVKDDDDAKEKIFLANKMMEKAIKHASLTETTVQIVSRIDLNIAEGIARAIRELLISEIIIGWHGKNTATEMIFGNVLDSLLDKTDQMILVSKIIHPLNTIKKILVLVPPNAELEKGFSRWIKSVIILSKQTGSDLYFYGGKDSLDRLKNVMAITKSVVNANYCFFEGWDDFLILSRNINKDDLFILISARRGTISYSLSLDNIPKALSKHFEEYSFLIIYPEQFNEDPENRNLQLDGMLTSPIEEDIQRINKFGKSIRKLFKNNLK